MAHVRLREVRQRTDAVGEDSGKWGWAREPYKRERVVGPCENGGRSGGEKESMVN